MSLAALKNLQELLFGRVQGVQDSRKKKNGIVQEEVALPLPERLWLVSWKAWIRIAKAVTSPQVPEMSLSTAEITAASSDYPKHFIPGTFHYTTLLSAFQPLYFRVAKKLQPVEMETDGVLSIFYVSL